MPARILQRIHFAVQDRAILLYSPVVPGADNPALVNDYGTNRDSTLSPALPGLFEGCLQEYIRSGLLS